MRTAEDLINSFAAYVKECTDAANKRLTELDRNVDWEDVARINEYKENLEDCLEKLKELNSTSKAA